MGLEAGAVDVAVPHRGSRVGALAGALSALLLAGLGSATTAGATFPGSNGKIAFTSTRDGDAEIWVMNQDGTAQTQLTHNEGVQDGGAVWSPDGRQLAFTRSPVAAGRSGVVVMNADGSGALELAVGRAPAWSPDGQRIAFLRSSTTDLSGRVSDLFVMTRDGTGQVRIPGGEGRQAFLDWSPDGSRIAVLESPLAGQVPTYQVAVMNADASGRVVVTHDDDGADSGPSWSPDGSRIAYGGRTRVNGIVASTAPDIYTMNPDGTAVALLTDSKRPPGDQEYYEDPVWSPDGAKIAFTRVSRSSDRTDVFVMNADGSGAVQLSDSGAHDFASSWQPSPSEVTPPASPPPAPQVAPPAQPDTTAPTVVIARRPARLRRGVVRVRVTCPATELAPCAGRLVLRSRARTSPPGTLGSARFRIAPGRPRRVAVRLSRAARTRVARRMRLPVTATARVTDAAGNVGTTSAALTVTTRPPR
jgi:TolB protein